jgi:hypothetical protein
VLRDQGHRWDAGKFSHQVAQHFHLLRPAAVDRHQHGVNRALSNDADGVGNRIPMHHRETAATGRVHSGPLDRQQDRGDRGRTAFLRAKAHVVLLVGRAGEYPRLVK